MLGANFGYGTLVAGRSADLAVKIGEIAFQPFREPTGCHGIADPDGAGKAECVGAAMAFDGDAVEPQECAPV